ncbi:MAG: protein phosphatase CheZ [Betaproteobacteria bacterium]|nr:protein phosphatase CheZ [Betaproteobacteria bacterium]
MAVSPINDRAGDNDELQALFDSVVVQAVAPKPAPTSTSNSSGDNDELQGLFDSLASQFNAVDKNAAEAGGEPMTAEEKQHSAYHRIGQMTRSFHDSLRELGYDRKLQETARQIPDARDRLNYIGTMTEQAASRVLNAADIATPLQKGLEARAAVLHSSWDKLYAKQLSVEEFKTLADETHRFLENVVSDSRQTSDHLLEIVMAQDFQDLTGQVIKKVVEMVANMESELLRVLIEVMPDNVRQQQQQGNDEGLLNGPVINAVGRDDVVTGQAQVDDLLESLGF